MSSTTSKRSASGTRCPAAKLWPGLASHRSPFGGLTRIKATTTRLIFAADWSRVKYAEPERIRSSRQLHHWRAFGRSCRWRQRTSKTRPRRTGARPARTGSRYRLSISAGPTSARPLIRTTRPTSNYQRKTQTTGSWWAACANTCTAPEKQQTGGTASKQAAWSTTSASPSETHRPASSTTPRGNSGARYTATT